ncbi:MAG: hypothetical protein JKY91_05690 [Emcibacter sp.]|nr:hypothetical protein [Emcibacter sp.]
MWKKFQDMSRGEQNKILFILGLIVLAGYFGLRYPVINKDMKHQESMANRRADRLAKRVVKIDDPKISTVRLGRQLVALDKSIQDKGTRLDVISRRFASLEDVKQIQELKLELSQLAERSGVYITSIGGNKFVTRENDRSVGNKDSQQLLKDQSRNRYERPLTTMKSRTTYVGLMNFLEGLGTLSYNLTVVRLEISVDFDEKKQELQSGTQPLEVSMLLAL